MILFAILATLLALDLAALIWVSVQAQQLKKQLTKKPPDLMKEIRTERSHFAPAITYGKAHNIGRRPSQQDSLGCTQVFRNQGMLAVVADGMGGLSGGDQVSARIVMEMLSAASQLRPGDMDGALLNMIRTVNETVNAMLGPEGIYRSGSTVVSVLATRDRFHWISVGDSRIYLYRDGSLIQLNQEHNLLQEWMGDILDGRMTYEEARQNPDGVKLTSFIGMGKLKHVDCSLRSIAIVPGDRILLMSDGVFNALPEAQMAGILKQHQDVQQAASVFEQQILAAQIPTQDNFTVAILGF